VVALTLLFASLPFIASGHLGVPGIGVNNDMAAHLIWADWLQDPTGIAPTGIQIGYPLGPHGLAATLSDALGTEPLYAFLGLLLAIPVITGLTSLNLFHELSGPKRAVAATLVALPYLAASTLGIAGFKELLTGLFLLSFVLILRTISRESEGRGALIVALGVLTAAIVASYSYPGLVWPAAAFGLWALGELILARREDRLDAIWAGLRRLAPLLALAAVALLALAIAELPRIKDFYDAGIADTVIDTNSKLRFPLAAPEALGVWPSGEFLLGRSELGLGSWQLFAAIGLIAFGFAAVWWLRLADLALPAGVAGAAVIYLGTLARAGLYVQAKALAVPAALIMAFIVGALLLKEKREPAGRKRGTRSGAGESAAPSPPADDAAERRRRRREQERGGRPRLTLRTAIAIPFIALAAYSSFLALRDAVVAPDDRFQELKRLRETVAGSSVLALTSDRYTDYYLRGAEVLSPAKNAEQQIGGRRGKEFRLPVDFDSAYARDLDLFDYVITTDAEYQSGAPPNFEEVDRTESYVLWKRNGVTPFIGVLAEASRPGRVFRCKNAKLARLLSRTGVAITWPRPVIAKRGFWEPDNLLAPGQSATQSLKLPPGDWDLSFQYSSESAPLEVTAGGLSAEMPPGVEGAIPFRPNEGPFWPVGEVSSDGGPVEITVRAKELSALQRALGADSPAVIGNIAATRLDEIGNRTLAASCGLYLDHYYLGAPGALQASKESGSDALPLQPTR
jgi:MFS family permease